MVIQNILSLRVNVLPVSYEKMHCVIAGHPFLWLPSYIDVVEEPGRVGCDAESGRLIVNQFREPV